MHRKMCLHSKDRINSLLSAFMIPLIKCHFKFDSILVGALLAEKMIVKFNFIPF